MWLLILGLVLFIGLVLVHEWGHYIVARRNGVEVEEFGLFFPPRAKVLTKRNGTEYTLNWLPLGGFVKLKGENDADTKPGTFGAATTWVKTKIMLAGVAMNLVTAFVLLTILALIGMPKLIDNQFTVAGDTKIIQQDVLAGYVFEGSPADKAGIVRGDELKTIGKPSDNSPDSIQTQDDLPIITKKYAGEKVNIVYVRSGQEKTATTTLLSQKEVEASHKSNEPKGYLGISPTEYTLQRSTWSAPVAAAGLMKQFTLLTFQGLGTAIGSLFQGDAQKASEQVSGPVGIFVVMRDGSIFGIEFLLLIIAIISLSLAIMNALPIPALDGGRLFVLLVSRAIKKPLTKEIEEWIHGAGFLFLIGLIILITVVDVNRFF
jgi:regulator of sigma E protease